MGSSLFGSDGARYLWPAAMVVLPVAFAFVPPIVFFLYAEAAQLSFSETVRSSGTVVAGGFALAASILFGLTQMRTASASAHENHLKMSPQLAFDKLLIEADSWAGVRLKQRITNVGLGNVFLLSVHILWRRSDQGNAPAQSAEESLDILTYSVDLAAVTTLEPGDGFDATFNIGEAVLKEGLLDSGPQIPLVVRSMFTPTQLIEGSIVYRCRGLGNAKIIEHTWPVSFQDIRILQSLFPSVVTLPRAASHSVAP